MLNWAKCSVSQWLDLNETFSFLIINSTTDDGKLMILGLEEWKTAYFLSFSCLLAGYVSPKRI